MPNDEQNRTRAEAAQDQQQLAYERTRVASERTIMAWMRTAVSLIGFGFSIPQLFGNVRKTSVINGPSPGESRLVGMVLIGLGVLGLFSGILQHARLMRSVAPRGRVTDVISVTVLIAFVLAIIGVYAFVTVVTMHHG